MSRSFWVTMVGLVGTVLSFILVMVLSVWITDFTASVWFKVLFTLGCILGFVGIIGPILAMVDGK